MRVSSPFGDLYTARGTRACPFFFASSLRSWDDAKEASGDCASIYDDLEKRLKTLWQTHSSSCDQLPEQTNAMSFRAQEHHIKDIRLFLMNDDASINLPRPMSKRPKIANPIVQSINLKALWRSVGIFVFSRRLQAQTRPMANWVGCTC